LNAEARLLTHQFVRFLFAGGVAAAANFGSRFLYSLALPYAYAIVTAYITGMVVAFILMRGHVFKAEQGKLGRQAVRFVEINLLAVAQTLFISLILARWLLPLLGVGRHAEAVAHLFGVLVPVVTSYFGHKLFTFR
jgi:putative flippase GtrA